jgi:hypothetical protein
VKEVFVSTGVVSREQRVVLDIPLVESIQMRAPRALAVAPPAAKRGGGSAGLVWMGRDRSGSDSSDSDGSGFSSDSSDKSEGESEDEASEQGSGSAFWRSTRDYRARLQKQRHQWSLAKGRSQTPSPSFSPADREAESGLSREATRIAGVTRELVTQLTSESASLVWDQIKLLRPLTQDFKTPVISLIGVEIFSDLFLAQEFEIAAKRENFEALATILRRLMVGKKFIEAASLGSGEVLERKLAQLEEQFEATRLKLDEALRVHIDLALEQIKDQAQSWVCSELSFGGGASTSQTEVLRVYDSILTLVRQVRLGTLDFSDLDSLPFLLRAYSSWISVVRWVMNESKDDLKILKKIELDLGVEEQIIARFGEHYVPVSGVAGAHAPYAFLSLVAQMRALHSELSAQIQVAQEQVFRSVERFGYGLLEALRVELKIKSPARVERCVKILRELDLILEQNGDSRLISIRLDAYRHFLMILGFEMESVKDSSEELSLKMAQLKFILKELEPKINYLTQTALKLESNRETRNQLKAMPATALRDQFIELCVELRVRNDRFVYCGLCSVI